MIGRKNIVIKASSFQQFEAYLKTSTTLNLLSHRYPHRAGIQHASGSIRCHLAGKLELLAPFHGMVFHLFPVMAGKQKTKVVLD